MPSKNTIQFSLPQDKLEQLENLAQEGESVGLCAKRLILDLLKEDEIPSLEDRLIILEKAVKDIKKTLETKQK